MTTAPRQPAITGLIERSTYYAEPGRLRVMNWNVQHASPERSRQQAGWIAGQPIDVAVLTEVSASHGATALIQELTDHGFTAYCPTGPANDYRVLIASRVGKLEPCPKIRTTHLPHRCVAARLRLNHDESSTQTVGIVGLYVPSRGNRERRNVDKRAFQNAVTQLIPRLPAQLEVNGPVLITGDLNVVEPDHQPVLKVFGIWEYDFYRAFSASGYTDAYRHLHPHQPDHSWYGRSGAGYRLDHAFCSSEQVIQSCEYDQRPRRDRLSDHAAMTVVLQWRLSSDATRTTASHELGGIEMVNPTPLLEQAGAAKVAASNQPSSCKVAASNTALHSKTAELN